MKKTRMILLLAACVAMLFPVLCGAQAKIMTKKLKISDFTTKTTKVVLSGNEVFDISYKEEITRRWRVSPFEFCTREEYESIKTNPDFYFLVPMTGQFKKESEPGLRFLVLVKGGVEDSNNPATESLTVVKFPYASMSQSSGREFVYFPAILDVIQDYTLKAMTSDLAGYTGLSGYAKRFGKSWDKDIYISKDDVVGSVQRGIDAREEDDVDEAFSAGQKDLLVCYAIGSDTPEKGSYCYKMVLSADLHELYYFDRHKISDRTPVGFLDSDLKIISAAKRTR